MSSSLIGQTINDQYLLTEVLGEGGMGIVFKAEDLNLNRRLCAIKLLKGQTTDPHEAKRFEAELQIISRLRSPHVVQVLNKGYFEGHRLYIVMELLEGEALSTLLKREGALDTKRAIQITKGILAGLSEAHDYGVVHRDLKPANIFITRSRAGDEITKVLDFGIAKDTNNLSENTSLTSASVIIGTPKYMAPEQFMKQDTDQRTDLYAVGLLLYQMLSGIPPYLPSSELIPSTLRTMPNEFKVGWLHINATPNPLQVHPQLWTLCERMLGKEPDQRPLNAAEVIGELSYILEQLQSPSSPKDVSIKGGFLPPSQNQPDQPSAPQPQLHLNKPPKISSAKVNSAPPPRVVNDDPSLTTGVPLISELQAHSRTSTPQKRVWMNAAGVISVVCALGISGYMAKGKYSTRGATCYEKLAVSPPGEYMIYRATLPSLDDSSSQSTRRQRVGRTNSKGSYNAILRRLCSERLEISAERKGYRVKSLILGEESTPNTTRTHTLIASVVAPSPKDTKLSEATPDTKQDKAKAGQDKKQTTRQGTSRRKSKQIKSKRRTYSSQRKKPKSKPKPKPKTKPKTKPTPPSTVTAPKPQPEREQPAVVPTPQVETSEPGLLF